MEADVDIISLIDGQRYVFDTDEQNAEVLLGSAHIVTLCEHAQVVAVTAESSQSGLLTPGALLRPGRYYLRFLPAAYGDGGELPVGLLTKWALHLQEFHGQPANIIRSQRGPWIREDTIASGASSEYEAHVPPGLRLRVELAADDLGEDVTWELAIRLNGDAALDCPERYIDDGTITAGDGILIDEPCPAGGGVVIMRIRNTSGTQRTIWADLGVSW
jgi:hypothetical protein